MQKTPFVLFLIAVVVCLVVPATDWFPWLRVVVVWLVVTVTLVVLFMLGRRDPDRD